MGWVLPFSPLLNHLWRVERSEPSKGCSVPIGEGSDGMGSNHSGGCVGVMVTAGGQGRLELAPTVVGGQTSRHG